MKGEEKEEREWYHFYWPRSPELLLVQ